MQPTIFSNREVEKSKCYEIKPNRRMLKTISDVLLIIGLAVMTVTGVGLYFAPSGRVARATDWTWLGLDKHTLGDVHAYFGFTMIAIALIHLSLNWRPLKSLLKTLNISDILKLTIVILIVLGGAVAYLWGWLGW
ncbi:DUF4405 domain-containing protein [Archaeoglobus neptunius]|uniref:DUF4405 domain-containing protein n=1 Tax=Archaeoglobus neptunius TaxID=2798580 RepID=UPI001925DDBD|nr:DUF4405 domain-containing protein [Archaeoglobus neptunius]